MCQTITHEELSKQIEEMKTQIQSAFSYFAGEGDTERVLRYVLDELIERSRGLDHFERNLRKEVAFWHGLSHLLNPMWRTEFPQ